MPQFSQRNGRFFVSYITGPSHVLLGLAFGERPATPVLVRQPAVGACSHGQLDEGQILAAVLAGIAAAKHETGRTLNPTEIIYVENDSPRYSLYQHCAYLIAQRVTNGESFDHAS